MDALETLQAWQAAQGSIQVSSEQGLPGEVREGAAISRYTWQVGELTEIREADGRHYRYEYGGDGRLLRVQTNQQTSALYDYDAHGWLNRVTRGDVVYTHEHDAQGHLLRSRRGNASPYSYQWQGERVSRARCDRESSDFEYDRQGRLVGLRQSVDDISLSLRFDFDADGRLEQVQFVEWQQAVRFRWDPRGRPTALEWNERPVARFGYDDAQRLAWWETANGLREETLHDGGSGQPLRKTLRRQGEEVWSCPLARDDAFRLIQEGARHYTYDAQGRLSEATEGGQRWQYRQNLMDQPVLEDDVNIVRDPAGRIRYVQQGTDERVFRHNDGDEMVEALHNGECIARCVYDHKGRLVVKQTATAYERYLYGADDGLLAIADEQGRPQTIFLRQPSGLVAMVDFRDGAGGELVYLHSDVQGNLVYTSDPQGDVEGPFASDPYGVPMQLPGRVPYFYRGRIWHEELGLYRLGCRWYAPGLRQFLSADTYTGAPDDERLVNPFINGRDQRMARVQILCDWLRQPRWRNRFVYCANDPVNRFDPNGHWSFGGVLLSLLGVIWTLPNTVFGLAIEITCLLGEVIRWLVWLLSGGNASWQTPGFDVAASGRLNAFALVFKGGWLGSFENLLGITFGNVFFVNGEYENHPAFQALPDPVSPPAYNGSVTIPKSLALYEHELRHVNQYGWWGPFFHLGLPIWGAYLWDVILNGYQDASMERDARDHGGF